MLSVEQKILILNHFGIKHTKDLNNRDVARYTGLLQAQISQYVNGTNKFPVACMVAVAANICYFKGIKEHPVAWIESLKDSKGLLPDVYELMHFIAENGRLNSKGRTEKIANTLVVMFNEIKELKL